MSFDLPAVRLTTVGFDSECTCARLSWAAWEGPRFSSYDIVRRTQGVVDTVVATTGDAQATAFVDSALDGNTVYFYHVRVRTAWPGVIAASDELSGLFHALDGVVNLSFQSNTELQAIDLTIGDDGSPVAVSLMISSMTARLMKGGFRFHGPLDRGRTQFASFQPDILSPVRVAAATGSICAAATDSGGQLTVVACTDEGLEAWLVVLGEGVPAGLYVDDSEVVAIDRDAIRYRLDAQTGELIEASDILQLTLATVSAAASSW